MCLKWVRLDITSRFPMSLYTTFNSSNLWHSSLEINSTLNCHRNRLDFENTNFGFNISDPLRNMLLSSGPLIFIFEPRPVDHWTLLNDVKSIIPWLFMLINGQYQCSSYLSNFPYYPSAFSPQSVLRQPEKTLFSPSSCSRRSINFCALGRVVSREIYSEDVFSTSYLRYPHCYQFPGLS